jgi:hypothetical protein
MKISGAVLALFLLLAAGCVTLTSDPLDAPPLIDAHEHIIPGLSAETIISLMDQAGVQKAVLMANRIAGSRPMGWEDAMVLEAYEKYPRRIIPFLTTVRGGRGLLRDEAFLEYAERQLKTGKFMGLGEFMLKHFAISGSRGRRAPEVSVPADSPWILAMMLLGAKYNVPLVIHMETTPESVAELDRALTANKSTKVIWAHQNPVKMGGGPDAHYARQGDPEQIAALLSKHPNLFADISVGYETRFFQPRDRQLPESWRNLYERYSDRFVVGLDLATSVMWEKGYLPRVRLIRSWLSQLSSDTAKRIASENIERILSAR